MSNISNESDLDRLRPIEIVVIGGSGLAGLGLLNRSTRDVDLVALNSPGGLLRAKPLPKDFQEAVRRVATDFGLPADWLNTGPEELMNFGLPEGFESRMTAKYFGDSLTVHFASRLDQIHFKLYAVVDQGPGKHESDLKLLQPTVDELIQAATWSRTHDSSDGYRSMLVQVLVHLGVEDADERI